MVDGCSFYNEQKEEEEIRFNYGEWLFQDTIRPSTSVSFMKSKRVCMYSCCLLFILLSFGRNMYFLCVSNLKQIVNFQCFNV